MTTGLRGRPHKIRHNPFPPLPEVPPPPFHVENNPHAKEFWYRIGNFLLSVGNLNDGVLDVLCSLCHLHAHVTTAYENGEVPAASTMRSYRAAMADFCLTPAAQMKIDPKRSHPAPEADETNPFGALAITK